MAKVCVNDKELTSLLTETITDELIKHMLNETNLVVDSDKLMEYLWLRPQLTGLNIDVFVDDGGSYKRDGHKLVLFARNGYDESVSNFLIFTVADKPVIINRNQEFHVSYEDIFQIEKFIRLNLKAIQGLANDKISQVNFAKSLRKVTHLLSENSTLINEMSRIKASDSKLPMDIWVDEGATYQGHAPRIKFKASNEQSNTREYSTITLTNPPLIKNLPNKNNLKSKDLTMLKQFVINNMDLLLKLCNKEIDYLNGFLPNMITEK